MKLKDEVYKYMHIFMISILLQNLYLKIRFVDYIFLLVITLETILFEMSLQNTIH